MASIRNEERSASIALAARLSGGDCFRGVLARDAGHSDLMPILLVRRRGQVAFGGVAQPLSEAQLYSKLEAIAQSYGTGAQEAQANGLFIVSIETENDGSWTGSDRTRSGALASLWSNFS